MCLDPVRHVVVEVWDMCEFILLTLPPLFVHQMQYLRPPRLELMKLWGLWGVPGCFKVTMLDQQQVLQLQVKIK